MRRTAPTAIWHHDTAVGDMSGMRSRKRTPRSSTACLTILRKPGDDTPLVSAIVESSSHRLTNGNRWPRILNARWIDGAWQGADPADPFHVRPLHSDVSYRAAIVDSVLAQYHPQAAGRIRKHTAHAAN